ncbi:hypothetical protein LSH36_58g14047, partial [Paralvinella palmiformis]
FQRNATKDSRQKPPPATGLTRTAFAADAALDQWGQVKRGRATRDPERHEVTCLRGRQRSAIGQFRWESRTLENLRRFLNEISGFMAKTRIIIY